MKRGWLLLLLLSVGLNIGLGYAVLSGRASGEGSGTRPSRYARNRPYALEDSADFQRTMERRFDHLARRLGLSPEVRQELWQSRRATAPHIMAQQRAVREARRRLHEAFSASPAEPDSVRQLLHELGRAQAALDSLVSASLLHDLKLLPPEKRQRYLDLMPWDHHGPREHGRGGPGRGPRRAGERREQP
jgi:Spy/CpxP family protein refolding chaperone